MTPHHCSRAGVAERSGGPSAGTAPSLTLPAGRSAGSRAAREEIHSRRGSGKPGEPSGGRQQVPGPSPASAQLPEPRSASPTPASPCPPGGGGGGTNLRGRGHSPGRQPEPAGGGAAGGVSWRLRLPGRGQAEHAAGPPSLLPALAALPEPPLSPRSRGNCSRPLAGAAPALRPHSPPPPGPGTLGRRGGPRGGAGGCIEDPAVSPPGRVPLPGLSPQESLVREEDSRAGRRRPETGALAFALW